MRSPIACTFVIAALAGRAGRGCARHDLDPARVQLQRPRRQPVVPAATGDAVRLTGVKDGKRARDVMVVTHANETIDGVSLRRGQRPPLSRRAPRGAHHRLVQPGRARQRLVLRRADRRARCARPRHEHGGHVDGGRRRAQPGIYMPAEPRVGQSGRQEYYKGHAEDHFKVIGRFNTVSPRGEANTRAHRGDDAARAGHRRSQDVRPRHRRRPRADRARPERAERAHLGDEGAVGKVRRAGA